MNIDWIQLAYENIEEWYECPICNYREHMKIDTMSHIREMHTPQEIKEFCSQ